MPLLFSTEYIKMGFEARNLLDEDTEWESAMCFAEQMVTEAVLNNVNGIIKKTENGVTLTFIKTPRKNQPEQKKSIRSATKATAEKKFRLHQKLPLKNKQMIAAQLLLRYLSANPRTLIQSQKNVAIYQLQNVKKLNKPFLEWISKSLNNHAYNKTVFDLI